MNGMTALNKTEDIFFWGLHWTLSTRLVSFKAQLVTQQVFSVSAAKSYWGPFGAFGRCHPCSAEPRGWTIDRHGRWPRRHARAHWGCTHAQWRHGSSEQRIRDGTAISQQTLPHGRSWVSLLGWKHTTKKKSEIHPLPNCSHRQMFGLKSYLSRKRWVLRLQI